MHRLLALGMLALAVFPASAIPATSVEPSLRLDAAGLSVTGATCSSKTVTVPQGTATSSVYGNGTFATTVSLTFDVNGNLTGYSEMFTGTTVSGQTNLAAELGSWGTCNPQTGAFTVLGTFRTRLTSPVSRTGTSDVYINGPTGASYRNHFTPDAAPPPPPPPPPPPTDADGDGIPSPADCNDSNPGIRPGAREIRGNAVDENCDSRAERFLTLRSSVRASWRAGRRSTVVRALDVLSLPRGATVRTTCTARRCAFRTSTRRISADTARIALRPLFRGRTLRPGTVIEIRITAPETIGKVTRYTVRVRLLPRSQSLCLPPGAASPRPC